MENTETAEPPKMCSKCGANPRMEKRTVCRKCHSRQSMEYQKRNRYRMAQQESLKMAALREFARLERWCRANNIKELAKQLAR